MRSPLCRIALGLWIMTIGVAGWFFVQGWTTPGTDGRTEIVLASAERDLILGEMRMLLKAVHGVVTGLAGQGQEADRTQMEQAARSAGMHMAEDVNPALMAKLPLPFKQVGMSIHQDMDALADAIAQKETPPTDSPAPLQHDGPLHNLP
jgi:hypothetical protein